MENSGTASPFHPDNSWEYIRYWGNATLYTDAAGRTRLEIADALGRVVRVVEGPTTEYWEAPYCDTDITHSWNLCTDYEYDALGNLTKVTQGGQVRDYAYDPLSRLIAARNPEVDASVNCLGGWWSECYSYNNNGNLLTKASPGVTATMSYDELNRITGKSYDDGTTGVGYAYDTAQAGCLDSITRWTITAT